MPTDHALLAPSSAKRWMTCHPSALLESREPEKNTSYTLEGTYAHSCAELLLAFYRDNGYATCLDTDGLIASLAENSEPTGLHALHELTQEIATLGFDWREMIETVHESYVSVVFGDYVAAREKGDDALLLIEQKLNLNAFIPEGFGSSDAIVLQGDSMNVYDLKYGKGVKVDADHNAQMMCYALGALTGPGELYAVDHITMCIIQPRLHHESRYTVTDTELLTWGIKELRPNANLAHEGLGDFVPGDHCRFCAVAPKCKALAVMAEMCTVKAGEPELMGLDDLSKVLGKLDVIKSWISKVEEYSLQQALDGNPIPGWKVVEGRSIRKISDQQAAIRVLENAGFDEAFYLKPKELKTITDLEKLLRKKGFQELLGDYVTKPQGKPTLVPASDTRPDFQSSAEQDFKDINI